MFTSGSYKLISCKNLLIDVQDPEEQTKNKIKLHEGNTNHRSITETYEKLRKNYLAEHD